MKRLAVFLLLGVCPTVLTFAEAWYEDVAEDIVVKKCDGPATPNQMSSKDMAQTGPNLLRDCWPPDNQHWMLGASFIYWQLDEAALDYVVSKKQPVSVVGAVQVDGLFNHLHFNHFDYQPGFRLNAGFKFHTTPWIVFGEYTCYQASHSNHVELGFPGGGFPPRPFIYALAETAQADLSGVPALNASIHNSFHYNVADVSFQRNILITKRVTATPFFGVQGAWIDQNQRIKYTVLEEDQTPFVNSISTNQSKWRYYAGGILLGINADWCLGTGFSLFSQFSAAALYGAHHYNLLVRTYPQPTGSTTDIISRINPESMRTSTHTRINAGLEWSRNWPQAALKLFAGWEFNVWTNIQEFYRNTDDPDPVTEAKLRIWDRTDIHLQGLTMGAALQF